MLLLTADWGWGCAVCIQMGVRAASLAAVMLLLLVSVRKEMGHRLLYASTEAVQKACASGDAPDWCRVSGALVF